MRTPHPYYHISTKTMKDGTKQKRMIFAVKHGRAEGLEHTTNLFDICDTCARYQVAVDKAFLNTFSNGVTCYTYYTNDDVSDKQWQEIKKACNLVLNLTAKTVVHEYLKNGMYNAQETFYLFATTKFAYYFMDNHNDDFEDLYKHFGDDIGKQRKLVNLKMSLERENVKVEAVKGTLERHPECIKFLYRDFESRMHGKGPLEGLEDLMRGVDEPQDV